jgi:murein DD-endopeptidase MepM/ murein hydrolase activator NlpD
VRRRPSVASVLGLALVLLASAVLAAGTPQIAEAQVSELQRQLAEAARERAATQAELRDIRRRETTARDRYSIAQRDYDAAVSQLRRVDEELDVAQGELAAAEQRAAEARAAVARALEEVRSAELSLEERRVQFETRVRAAFKYGQLSLTDVFTSMRDINDVVVTSTYVNAVVQQDRTMVGEMAALLEEVSRQRDAAVTLRVASEREQEEAERVAAAVAEKLARQRALTTEVNRTRVTLASTLRELREDADALEDHLKALEAAQAQIEQALRAAEAAERSGRGVGDTGSGWVKPVNGWLSSGFGNRVHPVYRTVRLHAGVDLAAATGTPIIASRGGTVTFVGWMSGYGQTVIVYHGGGVATLYAHMSAFSVAQDTYVAQGARLGSVGMTGTATGPHLHFEVRINGVPQNPCGFITC